MGHVPKFSVLFTIGNSNLSCLLPPVPCLARLLFSFWRSATTSLPYLGRQECLHTQKIFIGCLKEGKHRGGERNTTLAWGPCRGSHLSISSSSAVLLAPSPEP